MAVTPPDPPPPDFDVITGTAPQWNAANTDAGKYGYDSTNQAIKDANGKDNYLAVGVSAVTSGHVAWSFITATANTNNCVCCLIPQATFNVIKGGTLNTQNGQISYGGHTYQLQLQSGSSPGTAIAFAYQTS